MPFPLTDGLKKFNEFRFELNYNPQIGVSVNRVHIVIIICYKKALHLGIDQILVYIMATYRHGIVIWYFKIVTRKLVRPENYDKIYLRTLFQSCNLKILLTADTWLDILTVVDPDNAVDRGQYIHLLAFSNHEAWPMTSYFDNTLTSPNQICISYRNCNKIDNYEAFSNKAFALPGIEVLLASGVDFIISIFKFLLYCPYDQHALLINKERNQAKSTLFNQFYLSVTNT